MNLGLNMSTKKNKRQLQKHGNTITATEETFESRSPLPPASEYEKYASIEPTAPKRILELTEKNRDLFEKLSIRDMTLSFALRVVIIIGGLAAAAYCAYLGLEIAAAVTVASALGGGTIGLNWIFGRK